MSVSILIPCYNASSHLLETLHSALEQTEPALEIIAIDDGSSDDTMAILARFADRIQISQQANAGASITRNRLMARAKGEFLQFLDADDLLAPRALEAKLALARAENADAVYSEWLKFSLDGPSRTTRPSGQKPLHEVSSDAELATFTAFWAPPAAWLFRASFVRGLGGFRADLPVIQDARLLQDCAHAGARFARVNEVLASYREARADSLSQRNRLQFLLDCQRNAEQLLRRWQTQGTLSAARRDAVADCMDFVSRGLFERDPRAFENAVATLKGLRDGRRHVWPRLASALKRMLGQRLASQTLKALGRAAESA